MSLISLDKKNETNDTVLGYLTEELMATRFIDNGDGTVTDRETNLIWQKGTAPERDIWPEAEKYIQQLNEAGFAGS